MVKITNQHYPEDIFPPLTKEQCFQINVLLMRKMGFSLTRLSAHISRYRDAEWQAAVEKLKLSLDDSHILGTNNWIIDEIGKAFEGLMPEEKKE